MNKVNLVFDFSNIAMRALFTCSYASGGGVSTFDTDEECAVLIRKIAMDMSYVMRIFMPDRVIIAYDSRHPWRNSLYDQIENESYKGNRQKDTTKNWNKIFETLNDYKKILEHKGFVISEIPTAEADDLAALWKEESYKNGDSIILISSDKDWTQLVDFTSSDKFCFCFNPIASNKGLKKLYITEDAKNWLYNNEEAKTDIFFSNYNSYKETLRNVKTRDTKIDYEVINPNIVALEKIMCGDDGDNAPTIYEYYKNGKKVRMTPSRSKKIYEELNISTVKDLCEAAEAGALLPALEKNFKKTIDDIDMEERVLRQRKLVELNPEMFPSDIISTFEYHKKDINKFAVQNMTSIKLDDILKDTKYIDEKYNKNKKAKENSIFDNLKDLEKYINVAPSASLF